MKKAQEKTYRYVSETKYIMASGHWGEGLCVEGEHFYDKTPVFPIPCPFFKQEGAYSYVDKFGRGLPQHYGMVTVNLNLVERDDGYKRYAVNVYNFDDSHFSKEFESPEDAIRVYKALEQITQDELLEMEFDCF